MSRCPSLATEGAVTRFFFTATNRLYVSTRCQISQSDLHNTAFFILPSCVTKTINRACQEPSEERQTAVAVWKQGRKRHHTSDKSKPPAAAQNLPKSEIGWNRYLSTLRKLFYLFIFLKPLKRGPNQIDLHIWLVSICLVILCQSVVLHSKLLFYQQVWIQGVKTKIFMVQTGWKMVST